jgi:two-component system, chemotaxis family, chemotaxis protein CheY
MPPDPLQDKLILVVEDNEVVREGMAVVLGRFGCRVTLAADSSEALALLRGGLRPHLILLDMLTPGLDGWSFLEQRRRDPALAGIPVLITTALGVASEEWAAALGASGLLRKPVQTELLLHEVRRHCR